MDKEEIVREIAGLSSGTLSRLFDERQYERIDFLSEKWIDWVAKQDNGKAWATWQDCWFGYIAKEG